MLEMTDLYNHEMEDLRTGSTNDDPMDGLPDGTDGEQLFSEDIADGENVASGSTKVEPKKRAVRNPRPRLTVDTLRGPRGIQTIEDYFKDIKFKGKGYEREDLDEVMRRLQHWGHRMYPTYKFDDVLGNIERLGRKKPLQVHMSRYRLGLLEAVPCRPDGDLVEDNEEDPNVTGEEPFDEFDALLDEQIAISKIAPRTPGPSAVVTNSTLATVSSSRDVRSDSQPGIHNVTSDFATPLPPSQPSPPLPGPKHLSEEQKARIAENRRLAQERLRIRRLERQQQQDSQGLQ